MIHRLLCASLLIALAGCSKSAPDDPPAETPPATAPASPTVSTSPSGSEPDAHASADGKLNLNDATDAELMSRVPGVGERMAQEFEKYRPYISILQFRREMGKYVTPAQIAAFEKFAYVPVDYNECDADTLQQIPGVDESIANTLMNGRPYASEDAFADALGSHLSDEQVAVARTYLTE